MQLDRARQHQILNALATDYPNHSRTFFDQANEDSEIAILWYLREHQLIEASLDQTLSGSFIFAGARITAKGLDFLADDGGLSAILGTVVFKLHADTIRELLLVRINALTIPEENKSWLRRQVSSMSSEALKTVTKSLVEQGLQSVPDLVLWAQNFFPSVR